MKKILLIITLSLLTSSNSFAERLNWFFSKLDIGFYGISRTSLVHREIN